MERKSKLKSPPHLSSRSGKLLGGKRVVKSRSADFRKVTKVTKVEKSLKFDIPTPEEMLEAGLHFGHQVRRWHPSMEPYIYGKKSNVHIIDLFKTEEKLKKAAEFLYDVAKGKGPILFVGTKKQAQNLIMEEAARCGALYVSVKWVGGTLTNFKEIRKNIDKLKDLGRKLKSGEFDNRTKKERLLIEREIARLDRLFSGVISMTKLPGAIFIVDLKREKTACREALRTHIPIVSLSDTNNDISGVAYPIPGNDDALKSIKVIVKTLADAVEMGYKEEVKS